MTDVAAKRAEGGDRQGGRILACGAAVDGPGTAVDLPDPTLIVQAEEGKAALPFDHVLRLAGVLGRNDPISFALKLTRSYNP
jgi:hypothetical protein